MDSSISALGNLTTCLRHVTGGREASLGQLPWMTQPTCPAACWLAGETVAVQKANAVAAVVTEGGISINTLVHVSRSDIPCSYYVFGWHSVHVGHAVIP